MCGEDTDCMHARYCSPVQGRFLSVDPVEWLVMAPFAPGIGLAALAEKLGMLVEDRNYAKALAFMFVGDTIFWTAAFYGLATVYVRRRGRRIEKL